MSNGKSTVLALQSSLYKNTNPAIILSINKEQTVITASNISEADFHSLAFITNNPSFGSSYMYLTDIKVYLDNQLFPTQIFGLYPIVAQQIAGSDTAAFIVGQRSHKPFINGFQGGLTIGALIDTLASLSASTPDTYGKTKKFVLVLDPPPVQSTGPPTGNFITPSGAKFGERPLPRQGLDFGGPQGAASTADGGR